LFESIKLETQLTREKPKPAGGSGAAPASNDPPKVPFPPGIVPGAEIEAAFRPMHVVVEAQGGRRIIDDVIKNLNDIHQSLMGMSDPAQAAGAAQMFRVHLQSLSGNTTRLPPPFSTMLQTAANAFDADATGSTIARLNRALAEQVTEPCRVATQGKYPFSRGAGNDISIPDFEKLFATNGIIDRFFAVNYASYADTTKREWSWNQTSPVGRQLSPALLRDFQRAAAIRETYLRTGAAGFAFVARNMTIPPSAAQVRLEINGAIAATDAPELPPAPPSPVASGLASIFGAPPPPPAPVTPPVPKPPVAPTPMQWPGPAGLQKAAVIVRDTSGRTVTQQKDGPWGLFRLLDGASVQRAGETVMVRFNVSGNDVSYGLNAPSGVNPITSTLLREFRCPGQS
ncbi:MAG: type VI secretion IcmF C-terminal domain-containing protein, partial [Beijerinckiaceae bacterium]